VANGCFVVTVNRTGQEGQLPEGIEFWGQSFVADPHGNVLCLAPADQPATLIVRMDLALVDSVRTYWPFLRDRRIDEYGDLSRVFVDRM